MVNEYKKIEKKFLKTKKILSKSKFKYLCVTITTNTSYENKKIHCAPLRHIENILIFGIVVYSTKQLHHLTKFFDKSIDIIFVDTEKKIPFNIGDKYKKNYIIKKNPLSSEFIELGNLATVLKSRIKKIPILEFKPNDITVENAWHIVRDHFKILSKKKLTIFGAGNIGFKLALKLVESGVNVSLFRRSVEKCIQLSNTINLIKPISTLAEANFTNSPVSACYGSDGIIACANKKSVIKVDYLKTIKPNGIIIDLGKGNLDRQAVHYARKKKIKILRCDITETLIGYIRQNILNYFSKTKKINTFNKIKVISGGYMGRTNNIIVNNSEKPREILGVSDGYGNFKKKLSKKNISDIKKLKKYLRI